MVVLVVGGEGQSRADSDDELLVLARRVARGAPEPECERFRRLLAVRAGREAVCSHVASAVGVIAGAVATSPSAVKARLLSLLVECQEFSCGDETACDKHVCRAVNVQLKGIRSAIGAELTRKSESAKHAAHLLFYSSNDFSFRARVVRRALGAGLATWANMHAREVASELSPRDSHTLGEVFLRHALSMRNGSAGFLLTVTFLGLRPSAIVVETLEDTRIPAGVRADVLTAVAESVGGSSTRLIQHALASACPEMELSAARALARHPSHAQAVDLRVLMNAMRRSDDDTFAWLVDALAHRVATVPLADAVVRRLRPFLAEDAAAEASVKALRYLRERASTSSLSAKLQQVARMAASSEVPSVRIEGLRVLLASGRGSSSLEDELVAVLCAKSAAAPNEREVAAAALSAARGNASLEALVRVVQGEGLPSVRASAVRALEARAMSDPVAKTQLEALRAAGSLGD